MQIPSIQISNIRWSTVKYAFVWLVILSVLFLPRVVNHTETEDAYSYALGIVETDQWAELVHDHHKIYHIICHEIYGFTRLFAETDALAVLIGISKVCAILTLLILNSFLRRIGIGVWTALWIVGILSVTYNFWRYTHAAEINAMAWLGTSLCLLALTAQKKGLLWCVSLAIIGCVAGLIHTICLVPIAVVSGSYLFFAGRYKLLCVFLGIFSVLVFGIFSAIDHYQVNLPQKPDALEVIGKEANREMVVVYEEFAKNEISLKSFPRAVVGLGVCFIGTNLLMGLDQLHSALRDSLFKGRYLYEEYHMARDLPVWHWMIWGASLVSLIVFSLVLLRAIYRSTHCPKGFRQCVLLARQFPVHTALWIASGSCAFFVLWFEPGNPEMWALVLPTLALPFLILLKSISLNRLVLLYVLLCIVNYSGGMMLLKDPKRDYYAATLTPLLSGAKAGDLFVKSQMHTGLVRYTNYNYRGVAVGSLIADADLRARYEIIKQYLESGHKVFVHREVVERDGSFGMNLHEVGLTFVPTSAGGGEFALASR
jgi:hypothetical protein